MNALLIGILVWVALSVFLGVLIARALGYLADGEDE